jgi:ribosome biogenesis GTPase / thiamine phosphate phosphatase
LKIERGKEHFNLTALEKKDKAFGKMVRGFKDDLQKLSSKHNK